MADLTAIILTRNEEKNLEACIRSVEGFCSRICVVDSQSEDGTVELAKRLGADVYEHPFSYYADQFNWGIDNCGITTRWILRLDADERFTPEFVAADVAIHVNRAGAHGPKSPLMVERETRVLELMRAEGVCP